MNFGKINRFEQISNMGPSAYMAHNLPEGMEPGLKKTAFFDPVNFSFTLAALICEVEGDPDTCTTEIVQFTIVDNFCMDYQPNDC